MQSSFVGFNIPVKKILWLENGDIFGGAEMFSLDMFSCLPENFNSPIEITYAFDGLNPRLEKKIDILAASFPSHIRLKKEKIFLPQLRSYSFSSLFSFIKSVWLLREKIKNNRYDFCHANTVRAGFVLSIAGVGSSSLKKSFFSHDYTAPQKWLQYGLKSFQTIFACSYPIKHHIQKFQSGSSDIEVIENGVDIDRFVDIFSARDTEGLPKKFGIIGRIAQWKGQLTVLKAIENLRSEYGDAKISGFEFHVFGEASDRKEDQEFLDRLHHFVEENALEKYVFFRGFVALEDALVEIDAVIHASEEPEPFGRTPLEGAASRKLLFISNLGTPAQIFEDNKNALFFDPKDSEGLSELIVLSQEDVVKNTQIKNLAFSLVSEKFSLSVLARKFWKNFY